MTSAFELLKTEIRNETLLAIRPAVESVAKEILEAKTVINRDALISIPQAMREFQLSREFVMRILTEMEVQVIHEPHGSLIKTMFIYKAFSNALEKYIANKNKRRSLANA